MFCWDTLMGDDHAPHFAMLGKGLAENYTCRRIVSVGSLIV